MEADLQKEAVDLRSSAAVRQEEEDSLAAVLDNQAVDHFPWEEAVQRVILLEEEDDFRSLVVVLASWVVVLLPAAERSLALPTLFCRFRPQYNN